MMELGTGVSVPAADGNENFIDHSAPWKSMIRSFVRYHVFQSCWIFSQFRLDNDKGIQSEESRQETYVNALNRSSPVSPTETTFELLKDMMHLNLPNSIGLWQDLPLLLTDSVHENMERLYHKNGVDFTALRVLSGQEIGAEVDANVLRRAGALGGTDADEKKLNMSNHDNHIEPAKQGHQPSVLQSASSRFSIPISWYQAVLVTVTLFAAMTYTASFRLPAGHDDSITASKIDPLPHQEISKREVLESFEQFELPNGLLFIFGDASEVDPIPHLTYSHFTAVEFDVVSSEQFKLPISLFLSAISASEVDPMPSLETHLFLRPSQVLYPKLFLQDVFFNSQERDNVIFEPEFSFREGSSEQFDLLCSLFILLNSMTFMASVALIIALTIELSIKPWLLVLLSSIIGAYMCWILAASPGLFVTVFIIGSSILLATFLYCLDFERNLEFLIELGIQIQKPSILQPTSKGSKFLSSHYQAALITATLLATMTFTMPQRLTAATDESGSAFQVEKNDAVINLLFVLFNSTAFFTSLALITILTHELPIKPWLIVLISSAIGAFLCSTMAMSPHQFEPVLCIGSSVLLAAFLKCLDLPKKMLSYLGWMCTRNQVI